jgi:riboflavin kinase/FMN adenylyltransferase
MIAPVYTTLEEFLPAGGKPVVLTIGTFDGVHLGHRELLDRAQAEAIRRDALACVLTFRNHPRELLDPANAPRLLMEWADKELALRTCGVHAVLGLAFDRAFSQQPAEDFIRQVLVGRLRAVSIISGPNFRFGAGATGGPELLFRLSKELGYNYHRAGILDYKDSPISSTRIRRCLVEGDVASAKAMLGRPHRLRGLVVAGDRIGRTIGWPTANLRPSERILLPKDGVYAVHVTVPDGQRWVGMLNLGFRPTVNGREHRCEVHLIDFSGELEGEPLAVDFQQRLRDEQRFATLDDLSRQLANDCVAVRQLLG